VKACVENGQKAWSASQTKMRVSVSEARSRRVGGILPERPDERGEQTASLIIEVLASFWVWRAGKRKEHCVL
jgi:hypothetical protein